ncbi:MAG TPA: tetratricopeptide repeat protein [Terriglobales bacterium]|nr:tetratricopeptide repeat protein [Terriglobales bacterium]
MPISAFLIPLLALASGLGWSQTPPVPESSSEEIQTHMKAARAAEQNGDLQTAIGEYRRLIRLLPDVAEIYNNLGIDYYQAHQPELALVSLQRAQKLNPNLTSPVLFSGLALYQLGRYREASRVLEESCKLTPRDVLTRMWLVYTLIALGDYANALPQVNVALRMDPNNLDLLYVLYRVHLELGQKDTQKLTTKFSESPRVWQLAADQWNLAGDKERAASLNKEAQARLPDLEERRNTPDDELFWSAEEHEKAARDAAEKLAQMAPQSARSFQIQAEMLTEQLRFEDAVENYQKALELKADVPELRVSLGDILLRLNRPAEALQQYDLELEQWPNEWVVYFHKGLAYMQLNEEDQALRSFMYARRSEVAIPELHQQLGRLFLRMHKFGQAIAELTLFLGTRPFDPVGHYLLMLAYRNTGSRQLMLEQQDLFEKYSSDRKKRTVAQKELEQFQARREVGEVGLDTKEEK